MIRSMVSEIIPSQDEMDAGALSPETLARVVRQVEEEGYVIVRSLCPADPLETIRHAMDEAWDAFCRKPAWIGGGLIIGHVNSAPPYRRALIFDDILVNPIVFQITEGVLGAPVVNVKYGGNTNLPGSVPQMFHSDVPRYDERTLVVNIPLGDVDETNGATQIVPGTHKRAFGFAEALSFEQAGNAVSAVTQTGDVLIRFPSLLHRGTGNASENPRHMLGMWHVPVGSERDEKTPPLFLKRDCKDWADVHGSRLRTEICEADHSPFSPNYFPPGPIGAAREMVYRCFPATYRRIKALSGG